MPPAHFAISLLKGHLYAPQMAIGTPSNTFTKPVCIIEGFGGGFCSFGSEGFLSITFLVNVNVAGSYDYLVITRKNEKIKTRCVFNSVLLAQGKKSG